MTERSLHLQSTRRGKAQRDKVSSPAAMTGNSGDLSAEGQVSDIASFGMKWVENVATHAQDRGKGLIAASAGKIVRLFDQGGQQLKEFVHPSSVTGLVFDSKGKRIAASHYNGVSIWFVAAKTDTPRKLEWKGSHTGIAIHPEGEAVVVTAMQENALHGWKLPDGQHMRMSGYPAKTTSMSFTRNGKWLATSGADAIVVWPFFGGGPMGKAPVELAGGDGIICTQVASNPNNEIVAGGFTDGLVVVADISSSRILPVVPPEHGPISALAWNADGTKLAVGTETGFAAVVDFAHALGGEPRWANLRACERDRNNSTCLPMVASRPTSLSGYRSRRTPNPSRGCRTPT